MNMEEEPIVVNGDPPGHSVMYDAIVLFADEDIAFADELRQRLPDLQICTLHDLGLGNSTLYEAGARLIAERCSRIILVYSPEFLESNAIQFSLEFLQATNTEIHRRIIPVVYRRCQLPRHMAFYFKLYYEAPERQQNFWDILRRSVERGRRPPVKTEQSVYLSEEPRPRSCHISNLFKTYKKNT